MHEKTEKNQPNISPVPEDPSGPLPEDPSKYLLEFSADIDLRTTSKSSVQSEVLRLVKKINQGSIEEAQQAWTQLYRRMFSQCASGKKDIKWFKFLAHQWSEANAEKANIDIAVRIKCMSLALKIRAGYEINEEELTYLNKFTHLQDYIADGSLALLPLLTEPQILAIKAEGLGHCDDIFKLKFSNLYPFFLVFYPYLTPEQISQHCTQSIGYFNSKQHKPEELLLILNLLIKRAPSIENNVLKRCLLSALWSSSAHPGVTYNFFAHFIKRAPALINLCDIYSALNSPVTSSSHTRGIQATQALIEHNPELIDEQMLTTIIKQGVGMQDQDESCISIYRRTLINIYHTLLPIAKHRSDLFSSENIDIILHEPGTQYHTFAVIEARLQVLATLAANRPDLFRNNRIIQLLSTELNLRSPASIVQLVYQALVSITDKYPDLKIEALQPLRELESRIHEANSTSGNQETPLWESIFKAFNDYKFNKCPANAFGLTLACSALKIAGTKHKYSSKELNVIFYFLTYPLGIYREIHDKNLGQVQINTFAALAQKHPDSLDPEILENAINGLLTLHAFQFNHQIIQIIAEIKPSLILSSHIKSLLAKETLSTNDEVKSAGIVQAFKTIARNCPLLLSEETVQTINDFIPAKAVKYIEIVAEVRPELLNSRCFQPLSSPINIVAMIALKRPDLISAALMKEVFAPVNTKKDRMLLIAALMQHPKFKNFPNVENTSFIDYQAVMSNILSADELNQQRLVFNQQLLNQSTAALQSNIGIFSSSSTEVLGDEQEESSSLRNRK